MISIRLSAKRKQALRVWPLFEVKWRGSYGAQYFVVVGGLACCKDDLGCAR